MQLIINVYIRWKHQKHKLVELPARYVAYVRHQGYDRSIANAWHTLKAWANIEERNFSEQFGLHHSNPTWVELNKCRYVACVEIDYPILRRGVVNSMTIPAGLHAVFKLEGNKNAEEIKMRTSIDLKHQK